MNKGNVKNESRTSCGFHYDLKKGSCWTDDKHIEPKMSLHGDITTDVAVVGGGLTGLLTAYMLKKSGIETVVLEKGQCAMGITGNSTAKITAAHRLVYDKIAEKRSCELARMYANANVAAIEKYADIVKNENIDCSFERMSAFVYACDEDELNQIKNENRILAKTEIIAELTNETELPFETKGAIEYKNQAQFDPYKFAMGISDGLEIYENTCVKSIEGHKLITDNGSVTAKKIILCTHYPIFNYRGAYFIKLRQEASYALAVRCDSELHGMYAGVNKKMPTFRRFDDMIIVGGEGHKTGNSRPDVYKKLFQTARSFRRESEPMYFWYAQDCMTTDGLPYIGEIDKKTPEILVATGYGKWGMTSAMLAAEILTDKVAGLGHPLDRLISPSRMPSLAGLIYNAFSAAGGYIKMPKKTRICSHMGCPLRWNPTQKTWDCPCHGSRFDVQGNPIESPAIKRLK